MERIEKSIEQYRILLTELENIVKEQKTPYHSLTSIGGNCYATAVVEQPETIYVDIYKGLLVEYSIDAAIDVVKKRIEQLDKWCILSFLNLRYNKMFNEMSDLITVRY